MDNIQLVEKLQSNKEKLFQEISKVIIGQKNIVEHLFISLLCRGHILLEGVPGLAKNYQNIHLLPIYQKKIAYGSKGFPWSIANRDVSYEKGICPTAEKFNDSTYLGIAMCIYDFENEDVSLILDAFHKVWDNLGLLK